jgi:hypothetical protein
MKLPTSAAKIAVQGDRASNLINLLCSEQAVRFMGRACVLKLEILAQRQTGSRSLSSIAREYHVSKQAVGRLAKKARAIYGADTARHLTLNKG